MLKFNNFLLETAQDAINKPYYNSLDEVGIARDALFDLNDIEKERYIGIWFKNVLNFICIQFNEKIKNKNTSPISYWNNLFYDGLRVQLVYIVISNCKEMIARLNKIKTTLNIHKDVEYYTEICSFVLDLLEKTQMEQTIREYCDQV